MTNRYYSRNNFTISRDESSFDRGERTPSWLNEYAAILEKESVKSKSNDYSLYDQINSILGNKSKYSTVDEAVLDMQHRTGLYDILQSKKASSTKSDHIEAFKANPDLKTYIDNYIEDRPGTSIEAVIHNLLKINTIKSKLPETDDVPEEVKQYINAKIKEVGAFNDRKSNDNMELGKLDVSEDTGVVDDPFASCMPARGK
jgi:hypothetical protein